MLLVGLTGSIAMGKSTVASMFASLGVPVFDADEAVRDLYAGPAALAIEKVFPGVVGEGGVDREQLARRVLEDKESLNRLETLVHPEVAKARKAFLERARADGRRVAVLDVPLLFETDDRAVVDLVVVVSAGAEDQRQRALARKGMTEEKFGRLLSRQTPDAEKRQRAHAVFDTSCGLEETRSQVRQFVRAVAAMETHVSA